MDAPFLTPAAVEKQVKRLSDRSRSLIAIFGTGTEQTVAIEGRGDVPVVPVRSELELRARLPGFEDSALRVFLVPWYHSLPDDLAGRFVSNGRVYRIDRGAQLAALMGATRTDEAVGKLALAEYLLSRAQTKRYRSAAQVVSVESLYEIWLSEDWTVPTEGGLASDALLAWAASNGRGDEFVEAMKAAPKELRAELEAHLQERVDRVLAPVIWRAWERGAGLSLLALAVLCEALVGVEDGGVQMWLKSKCRTLGELAADADVPAFAKALGRIVRPALAWLKSHDPTCIGLALRTAEELVDDADIGPHLIHSTRLPHAWERRLHVLSKHLGTVAEERTRPALADAERAWRALESHEFFLREDQRSLIEGAEMALRLAAWLTVYAAAPFEPATASYGDVETLGSWYAQEGGYIDLARRRARAVHDEALRPGATDAVRQELDQRFAKALEQWVYAGRPSQNVLPIEAALERVAARFLAQEPSRTLLVLLMDGMAWAQAVELLPSLGEDGRRWGPIAWHSLSGNRMGSGAQLTMLAALPTVTEFSRAAFFAGALPKASETLHTAKDTERFASNKAMHSFCEPGIKSRLLLRGDGHTADGSLSAEALHLIAATKEQRVAALVINAIDSSLHADSQQEQRWRVESIRSLRQILDAARDAGRHILLVADHGHVAADRLKNIGPGDGGGARWRLWRSEGDALQPGERRFSGEGVRVPRGSEAIVLLEHDGVRYGGAPSAGEHGGAALAEVVAPCMLLGYEDEVRSQQDPALAVRGLSVPDWWTRALPHGTPVRLQRSEPVPSKSRGRAKAVPEAQMGLPGVAPEPPPSKPQDSAPPPPSNKPKDLLPAMWNNPILEARTKNDAALRAKTVAAVHFLLERMGAAPLSAFAAHLSEPEFRAGGLISKLQEVVNLDGYSILRFDSANRQVFLDKEKLEQQFQVKL